MEESTKVSKFLVDLNISVQLRDLTTMRNTSQSVTRLLRKSPSGLLKVYGVIEKCNCQVRTAPEY